MKMTGQNQFMISNKTDGMFREYLGSRSDPIAIKTLAGISAIFSREKPYQNLVTLFSIFAMY